MEFYTYKGISAGKYIEGEIEALNQDEASHKLKADKVIITNLVRSKKKKLQKKRKKKGAVFHLVKKKLHLKIL
jgi:type IV pilus assembly protein PilC